MSLTPSTMLPLGTQAPDFTLPDINNKPVSLSDFKEMKATLVVFMCNHCPYVKHIIRDLVEVVRLYQSKGIGVVAINSNNPENYPEDSPEKMALYSQAEGFTFPYLFDAAQEVAKAYKAACTPDFYLFDKELKLVYRGQLDDSRPGNGKVVTGKDLIGAMDAVLRGQSVKKDQKPSMGCNIKWTPGNEPDYFK